MEPSFWQARWNSGRIGFHNDHHHPLLERHWPRLSLAEGARVLVPLAGKSLDLTWLAQRGHEVVGVELSEIAVRDYFAERGVSEQRLQVDDALGGVRTYSYGGVRMIVADLFDLTPPMIGSVQAIYDRAALIALPPEMRCRYVEQLGRLAPAAPTLLITVEYDPSLRGGPPFSVEAEEVSQLWGSAQRLGEAPSTLRDLPVVEAAYQCMPPSPAD